MDRAYMSAGEAAAYLNVSPSAIRQYTRRGRLTPVRVDASRNMYPRDQIESLRANRPVVGRPKKTAAATTD